jgi:ABC-type glycerol-3-phosphate transport system substrate-binding protein
MTKKRLAPLGAVLSLSLALTACGGDDGGGSDSGGKQKIEFSLTGGTVPAQVQVVEDAIAAFEKANPDAEVELTQVGWGESYAQYQTRLQAGNPPDVALLAPSWVSTFIERDAFAPVDDYVDGEILDSMVESGYNGIEKDGTRFGVPWDASVWGMFYRKDLFEQAGLDPNKPPTTWAELEEYATKLKASGVKQPFAFPFKSTDPDDYFLPFLWQAGGEVTEEQDGQWEPTFDSPESEEAAEFVAGLVEKGLVSPDVTGSDWEATMNGFIAGDTAMMMNGMWAIGSLQQGAPDLKDKWATAAYPAGPAGQATLGYPNALVISDLSENKALAGEFINFFFNEGEPSYFFQYMKVTGVLGWTEDFAETDDPFVKDPLIVPLIESVPFARSRPLAPWYEELRQRHLNPNLQEMVRGSITPEEMIQRVTEGADQLAAAAN